MLLETNTMRKLWHLEEEVTGYNMFEDPGIVVRGSDEMQKWKVMTSVIWLSGQTN